MNTIITMQRIKHLQSIFIFAFISVLAFSGCKKGSEFDNHPLVGEWSLNGISIGIYHGMDQDLEVIQELPVDEGGMEFNSKKEASFVGEDLPKWMPKKFDWDTRDDTLIMEFYGYEIKSLFNIRSENSQDYLDILFGTDSVGIIMAMDTVMQLSLQK